jgi:proton-coupled amino acid transporter
MDVLDKVVGIMGSLLGIPLAYMFPPLIHNKLGGESIGRLVRIGNVICVGLGFLAVAISTIAIIVEWS